jgi:hypothetical protein
MQSGVDLYWLPLGAGGHSVRLNGRIFEALAAGLARRPRLDPYHSALEVRLGGERYVIESAPIALAPEVPTPVVGRDELRAGEMWNSNSLIAWLIVGAGLPVDSVHPPAGGRAPGWDAGIVVARRGSTARRASRAPRPALRR